MGGGADPILMFKGNVGGGLFEVYDHFRWARVLRRLVAVDVALMHF